MNPEQVRTFLAMWFLLLIYVMPKIILNSVLIVGAVKVSVTKVKYVCYGYRLKIISRANHFFLMFSGKLQKKSSLLCIYLWSSLVYLALEAILCLAAVIIVSTTGHLSWHLIIAFLILFRK